MGKDNMVMVLGEITTGSKLDYDAIVRGEVKGIGYDSFVDDLGSAVSKGLSCKRARCSCALTSRAQTLPAACTSGSRTLTWALGTRGSCSATRPTRPRSACPHSPAGHVAGQEADGRAEEWASLVAEARRQDAGDHRIPSEGRRLRGASKDPHRGDLDPARRARRGSA